jgi:hypothetical protein
MIGTLAPAFEARAQEEPKVTLENLYVDLAVPDLPALSLFGLNPSKVSRPGTLKELSVSVFPLAGAEAAIGPGVAVAWAPVYTFANSIDDYRKPVLRRLAFSLVTSKEGKTDAVNAGFGVRVMLHDGADPIMSPDYERGVLTILASGDVSTRVSQAFQQNQARPLLQKLAARMAGGNETVQFQIIADLLTPWDIRGPAPTPFTVGAKVENFSKAVIATADRLKLSRPDLADFAGEIGQLAAAYLTQVVTTASTLRTQLAKHDQEFRESHWNAPVVSADAGVVAQSPTGKWGDLADPSVGGLFSAAFPAGRHGQIVLQAHGQKRTGAESSDTSNIASGARYLVGTSTKRFSAEFFMDKVESTDAEKHGTSRRFTVGAEFRLGQGFWVEAAFGSDRRPGESGWHLLSLANFKYAFKSAARFTQIPGSVESE